MSTVQQKVKGRYFVLMIYCGCNNNTFKLFLEEHMAKHGYKSLTISFGSHR